MSVLPLPLPLHKIILDYCSYPKKYLPELTKTLDNLKGDFDRHYRDIAMTNLAVANILNPGLYSIEIFNKNCVYKESIILDLFNRENKRRELIGLPKNESIYNIRIGNIIAINY